MPFPPAPEMYGPAQTNQIHSLVEGRGTLSSTAKYNRLLLKRVSKEEFKASVIFGICKNVHTPYANTGGLHVNFVMNAERGPEGRVGRDNGEKHDREMLGETHFGECRQIYLQLLCLM